MSAIDDFHTTRQCLLDRLADMAALQPFADPGNASSAPFVDAFEVARSEALVAAKNYVDTRRAVRNLPRSEMGAVVPDQNLPAASK
jgi:hypothetical protein